MQLLVVRTQLDVEVRWIRVVRQYAVLHRADRDVRRWDSRYRRRRDAARRCVSAAGRRVEFGTIRLERMKDNLSMLVNGLKINGM